MSKSDNTELFRNDLKHLKNKKENDYDVFVREIKQFLEDNYPENKISTKDLIINLDKLTLDLHFDLMIEENITKNWEEFSKIIKIAVSQFNDKIKNIYYTLNHNNSIIKPSYFSNVTHKNCNNLFRFVGNIDSIGSFEVTPDEFLYQCDFCQKKYIKRTKKPTPACNDVSCVKNFGRSKCRLMDIKYVSRKYFIMTSQTSDKTQGSYEAFLEITDYNENNKFIFSEELSGKKIELLCIPEIYEVMNNTQKVSRFRFKLLGVMEHKGVMITNKDRKEVIDKIKTDYKKIGLDVFNNLAYSFTKKSVGHEYIRQALLCVAVGLDKKDKDLDKDTNKAIHMMMLGDPAVGKTFTTKQLLNYFDGSSYLQGVSTSSAGLLGGCDKIQGLGMVVKSGEVVKANNSFILLDEVDKMPEEQTKGLFTALSEGKHTISKVTGTTIFEYNTSFIMVANPKGGSFNPYSTIKAQITLDPAFLSRMDIATIVKQPYLDDTGKEKIEDYTKYIKQTMKEDYKTFYNDDFLKKYAVIVKEHPNPKLTKEIRENMVDYFIEIKQKMLDVNDRDPNQFATAKDNIIKGVDERQKNTIIKLSKAIARACFCTEVKQEHFMKALDIINEVMLKKIMKEFGTTDLTSIEYDLIEKHKTKIPSSDKEKGKFILNLIMEENDLIEYSKILSLATDVGITESECDDLLNKLQRNGDIMEPKRGFWSKSA